MAVGWKMTQQIPIFPPHSAFIPLPSLSRHSFSGEVVSHPTVNGIVACKDSVKPGTPRLNSIACNWHVSIHYQKSIKILVHGDVHMDAARNKDNLLYFCKILRINELHGCN